MILSLRAYIMMWRQQNQTLQQQGHMQGNTPTSMKLRVWPRLQAHRAALEARVAESACKTTHAGSSGQRSYQIAQAGLAHRAL